MDYQKLSTILLERVFSNSAVRDLEEFIARLPADSVEFASGGLTGSEWERLRWGYWAAALATCVVAWGDTWKVHKLDKDRMIALLNAGYPRNFRDAEVRVRVGSYLTNRTDLRALKRSGAVPCPFLGRIEEQTTTRGTLTVALATHRVTMLLESYVEGCRISPLVDDARNGSGEPTGFLAEMLSGGVTNRTKDGFSRTAMVFAGMILDDGEFRHDEKSSRVADLLLELLEQNYKEFRDEITQYASDHA